MTYETYISVAKKTGAIMDLPEYYYSIKDDQMLESEEISEAIGVHLETVRRWFRDGKLQSEKYGRIYISGFELKKYLFEKDKRRFLKAR